MKGKTSSGFKFEVDDRIIDDWRLLEAVSDTTSEDSIVQMNGLVKCIRLMLGDKGLKDLKEHIAKSNDGYIPSTQMNAEVTDIMNACKAKNS